MTKSVLESQLNREECWPGAAASAGILWAPRALWLALVLIFAALSLPAQQDLPAVAPGGLARAQKLVDQGKLRDAEDVVRSYLREHTDSVDARYMLAYILFRQNSPVPSLSEYTRAARLRVPTAQQLSTVALDYVLAGDYADADKWMTKVTVMTPTDSEAWYSLGRIKYTENRFQEAIDCFTRSLVLSPHSVKAENNLGLAEEGLNQVDAAVTAYQTAITWQADVPSPSEQPLVNLGLVLIDRNELEEALPLLRQAEKIAPEDARIRAALGRLYQKQGQLPQAQAELERAVALAPKTAAYHFLLGQVYHRAGMGEQAKSEFSQAAAIGGSGSSR